jgi:long-chain acyl-CoA synthetase
VSAGAVGRYHLALAAESARERKGDYPSLFFEGRWYGSGELHARAARVAAGLRGLGVDAGDRVAVLMMNVPEVLVTYEAVWRSGAAVTPIIFLQTPPELRHILTDSGARVLVVTAELVPLVQAAAEGVDVRVVVVGDLPADVPGLIPFAELEAAEPAPIHPRDDDDLAALLYTGGTTGRAKGVMLSHRGLYATGNGLAEVSRSMGTSRSVLPLPLSHAYGLNLAVADVLRPDRGVNVVQRWFDAKNWLELVQEHRVESGPVVPTMLSLLLAQPLDEYDLSSLRILGSGGAPLPAALREEAERRLGATLFEGYGCTESSAAATASTPQANRPGSVGRALPHARIAVVDADGKPVPPGEVGEVCIGGDGVMLGYWNDPDQTAAVLRDGWLSTGDLGRLDDDGFLYIVDRKKDLIIRGGFNVYPRDVEDVLMSHPDVVSAAVVGRPDPEKGEEVVAVVAVRPGAAASREDLLEYAAARLAKYKYPREIRVVDAVPVTSVGKIDRRAVRTLVTAPAGEDAS